MKLTPEQSRVLALIQGGADVYGYVEAVVCRELERMRPPLIRIVPARGAPRNGARQQPYFGVRETAVGRRALEIAA